MASLKTKVAIGAAATTFVVAASSFIIGTTSYVSLTEAMLYIMETEEAKEEIIEEEEPVEEEDPEPIPIFESDEYFDELHKLIANTDINAIPDDARLPDEVGLFIPTADSKAWTLKTYLYYYQLLAEICMRSEVNPPDTEVKITPLALMGKMYTESALCNYNGYSGFKDTALLWQTEQAIIDICDRGNISQMLALHAADTYTYEEYAAQFTCAAALYACGGPVGQAFVTSFNWDASSNAIAAVYISKEENPSLDDDKRGIVGLRKDIYEGNGIYADENMWSSWNSCDKATYDDIKSSIAQGIFDKSTPMGYKTRPATYYVPDACYTLALSMRASLENKSPLNFKSDFNKNYMDLVDLAGADVDAVNTQYVMQALSLYPQLAPASTEAQLDSAHISTKEIGAVAELYGDFLYNSISFVPIKDLLASDAITLCSNAPANIVARFVGGVKSISNWYDLAETIPSSYVIGSTTVTPILYQLQNSKWDYSLFNCEYEVQNGYTAPYNAVSSYSGELGSGMWYSFNCINVGYLLQQSCDEHIRYAYSMWGIADTPDGMIDGETCLNDECWHKEHPEASRSIEITSASDVDKSKVYSDYLSSSEQAKLDTSILHPVSVKSTNHNNGKSIYAGLALPVTFENGETPELLLFATYSNHAGDAVDFHVETYDEVRVTASSEIHAIADGYIVEIRQFPYYKRTDFNDAQTLFSRITARTDHDFSYASCGNMVKVMHIDENGNIFYSRYLHLRDFAHISVGAVIEKGGLLGYTGTTGFSTGEHPHITILTKSDASIGYLNLVKSYLYDLAPGAISKLDTAYDTHNEYLFIIKRKEDETWEYYETRYAY